MTYQLGNRLTQHTRLRISYNLCVVANITFDYYKYTVHLRPAGITSDYRCNTASACHCTWFFQGHRLNFGREICRCCTSTLVVVGIISKSISKGTLSAAWRYGGIRSSSFELPNMLSPKIWKRVFVGVEDSPLPSQSCPT